MRKAILISILTVICIAFANNSKADWQIDMDVYTPDEMSDTGNASNNLSLGSSAYTTEQYDNKFDTIALTSEPVNAYFYHPEYRSNVQKLWRDFRGVTVPQEWEFEVQSTELNKTVNIKWQIEDHDNLYFILVDRENGTEINMTSVNEYSFINDSALPKKFLLKIAKNDATTTVDNDINEIVTSGNGTNGSGSTGTRGGGCGYIKDINGERNNNSNNGGNNAINMMILLVPMLFPFKQYFRRYAYIVINR